MSPLASTGTLRAFLISLMKPQLARTSLALFCSRVRPCTATSCAPAASTQGLTLVHFSAQLEVSLPVPAQLKLTVSPI